MYNIYICSIKHFKWFWNEQKLDHGARRGPEQRMTVLATVSSNLLLCCLFSIHTKSKAMVMLQQQYCQP
jgi:hypothetical protein